jgi:hypothetical protein
MVAKRSAERADRGVAGVSERLTEAAAAEGVGGHDGLRAVRWIAVDSQEGLAFPGRALGA